jgi:mannose-6-phosphate isomerase-like protein (cupin superfamily)
MACAETEPGAFFPPQYHQGGGNEMAVCLSGEGAIVVGEEEAYQQSYPFEAGDALFIPPGIVYHVRNRRTDMPLKAVVFFGATSVSYWPNGTMA